GKTVALACRQPVVRFWDLDACVERESLKFDSPRSVAYSPDGRILATGTNNAISLWNTADGSLIRQFGREVPFGYCQLILDPTGRRLACNWGAIEVWEIESGSKSLFLTDNQSATLLEGAGV